MSKTSAGTKAFRVIYFTLTAAAIAAICFGLSYLWRFLEDYERTLPVHIVDSFVEGLNEGNYSEIYKAANFQPNDFEGQIQLVEAYSELLCGNFTHMKLQTLSTEQRPVYKIKSDGNQVALLSLKQSGVKSEFGFPLYEVGEVEVPEIATHSVQISAMSGLRVYLNGVLLGEKYITDTGAAPAETEFFHGYIQNPPLPLTYTVDGLIADATFFVADADGNEVMPQSDGIYGMVESKNDELTQMALDFSKLYTRYIAADAPFSEISDRIPHDLRLYEDLYYYEGEFYSWHYSYDFRDEWVGELLIYSDDCFSARVKYTHVIDTGKEHEFPVDNTIYFARIDGEYKVTDVVMNFE